MSCLCKRIDTAGCMFRRTQRKLKSQLRGAGGKGLTFWERVCACVCAQCVFADMPGVHSVSSVAKHGQARAKVTVALVTCTRTRMNGGEMGDKSYQPRQSNGGDLTVALAAAPRAVLLAAETPRSVAGAPGYQ